MQKVLEAILVIIVFYGVFSAFTRANEYFELDYPVFIIALAALLFSAALLLLYGGAIRRETKKKLQCDINNLKDEVKIKDQELTDAFKIKKAVEEDALDTIENVESTETE